MIFGLDPCPLFCDGLAKSRSSLELGHLCLTKYIFSLINLHCSSRTLLYTQLSYASLPHSNTFRLTCIWPSLQLESDFLCKHIVHWVCWVEAVQPEILVDWNSASCSIIVCWRRRATKGPISACILLSFEGWAYFS